jgi:hypothetical protein
MGIVVIFFIGLVFGFLFKKKFPILKKPGIYILIPACLFAPVALVYILFGLSGSDKQNFLLMGIGYIIVIVFSFASLRKQKLVLGAIFGLILIGVGGYKDSQFWKQENSDLCDKLRADPNCVETQTGFNCSDKSSLGGFSSANMCSAKFTDAEIDKRNLKKRNFQIKAAADRGEKPDSKLPNLYYVSRANRVYEDIVKKIISSENPGSLNFEEQLKAIYNCINDEYDNSLKAEAYTTMTLQRLAKTADQIEKYRSYAASKGRMINPNINISALSAGNKKFNCTFLLRPK